MAETNVVQQYLRTDKLPHIWCAGCGNGTIISSLIRAFHDSGLKQEDTVIISGIGCSGRATGYLNFCAFQPTHGRALPYATGVKFFKPQLNVITIMGDGDCMSIGGNHFLHAARRNMDITAIVFNNSNYGMTGGQYAPTTPLGAKTATSPYGHFEPAIDICKMAQAAGVTYVARTTTYHVRMLTRFIKEALLHPGFSLVEAICSCPSLYGRLNKEGGPREMLRAQKERAIGIKEAAGLSQEELDERIVIGEFVKSERPEYIAEYQKMVDRARKEGNER